MRLIFVYNAKSNLSSKAFDFAHKILSPETYSCELCKITHHQIGERQSWTSFREQSDMEMNFLYKDEFEKKYTLNFSYPVILVLDTNKRMNVLMNKDEIAKLSTAEELREALIKASRKYKQQ